MWVFHFPPKFPPKKNGAKVPYNLLVYLGEFGKFNGNVEGEGDDDLEDDDEGPEGQEPVPQRVDLLDVEEGQVGSHLVERVDPQTGA